MIDPRILYPGGNFPALKRRLERELYWLSQNENLSEEERQDLINNARFHGISEDVIGDLTARPNSKNPKERELHE